MGRGFVRPQEAGMGWESFFRHAGRDRDVTRKNHAKQGQRPYPLAPPRPAPPHYHQSYFIDLFERFKK